MHDPTLFSLKVTADYLAEQGSTLLQDYIHDLVEAKPYELIGYSQSVMDKLYNLALCANLRRHLNPGVESQRCIIAVELSEVVKLSKIKPVHNTALFGKLLLLEPRALLEYGLASLREFTGICNERFKDCYYQPFNYLFDFSNWHSTRSPICRKIHREFEEAKKLETLQARRDRSLSVKHRQSEYRFG